MAPRQSFSIEEIKDRLLAQIEGVVARYAPPAQGSFRKGQLYATLNPGRADRSVGSFFIHMSGPKAGRWNDYAMSGPEGQGDIIDLIRLSCGFNTAADALKEARAFLGLEHESPELTRARAEAADRAKAKRAEEAARQEEKRQKARGWAKALYLSAREKIRGTPVDYYLRNRAIDLAKMDRVPHALRYHAHCNYLDTIEEVDPETGEVTTRQVRHQLPAMVAAIVNGKGEIIAAHRTYLAFGDDGRWGKAKIPDAKKVLGDYAGGSIRLSTGYGPRGGKGARLSDCPPGTRVYIAEGIETALSVMVVKPEARVLAAVSLANMAKVELPQNVSEVVLLSDGDDHPQAVAAFEAAIKAHAAKGRTVRVWRSEVPGEDFNDALIRARNGGQAA